MVMSQSPHPAKLGTYLLQGEMYIKKEIIPISGAYVIVNGTVGYVKLASKTGLQFEYQITPHIEGCQVDIKLSDLIQKTYMNLIAKLELKHQLEWKFKLETVSTNPKWDGLGLETEVQSPVPQNITLSVNLITHFRGLEEIHSDFNLLLQPNNAGIAKLNYELDDYHGNIVGSWSWVLVQNMELKLLADYEIPGAKKSFETHLFYLNPERSFKKLRTGADFIIDKHDWA